MSEMKRAAVGMVIRPDGTVPFDEGHDPRVKDAIIAHLAAVGHTVTHHPEGHLTIHGFDPAVGLNPWTPEMIAAHSGEPAPTAP